MSSGFLHRADQDWKTLCEFFGDLASQESVDASLELLLNQIEHILPVDRGVSIMRLDGRIPFCIRWPDYSERLIPQFNAYFNRHSPLYFTPPYHVLGPVDWNRYDDSLYHNEFNRPLQIRHSIGLGLYDASRNRQLGLFVHRGPNGPAFSERDTLVMQTLRHPLTRILSLISREGLSFRNAVRAREATAGCDVLSRREAEVAELICRRLSMRQIAKQLGISPRTVERHALHIYRKLDVCGRVELVKVLGSTEPASMAAECTEGSRRTREDGWSPEQTRRSPTRMLSNGIPPVSPRQ